MKLTLKVVNLFNADKHYADTMFKQRTEEKVGSYLFGVPVTQAVALMMTADFVETTHPLVTTAKVWRSVDTYQSSLGVYNILPQDNVIIDDPKGTGFAYAHIVATTDPDITDEHIYAIGNDQMIFTFHPGEPEAPSTIPFRGEPERISGAEAIARGFTKAKVIAKECCKHPFMEEHLSEWECPDCGYTQER